MNGFELERDPIVQAKAWARGVQRRIKAKIGLEVPVRGGVIYPRWFAMVSVREAEVLVMNEGYFEKFVVGLAGVLVGKESEMMKAVVREWGREE